MLSYDVRNHKKFASWHNPSGSFIIHKYNDTTTVLTSLLHIEHIYNDFPFFFIASLNYMFGLFRKHIQKQSYNQAKN